MASARPRGFNERLIDDFRAHGGQITSGPFTGRSLLLLTTIAPMFLTDRGMPPLSLILWVTLAGYLMAGGANAINMWFDRDIDQAMARTRLRPIPAGRIARNARPHYVVL